MNLSTLPDNDGYVATKEHVQDVLDLMCYFKAKAFADNDLPCWPKLLVHRLFNHLGSCLCLKNTQCIQLLGKGRLDKGADHCLYALKIAWNIICTKCTRVVP